MPKKKGAAKKMPAYKPKKVKDPLKYGKPGGAQAPGGKSPARNRRKKK